MTADHGPSGPIALLSEPFPQGLDIHPHLFGFGGLMGGLSLAVACRAVLEDDDRTLRSISGHYLRPVKTRARVDTELVRRGRTASVVRANVWSDDRLAVAVTATLGEAAAAAIGDAPDMLDVPPPEACESFLPPIEFVPFARHVDIRPATPNLPYFGGDTAELTAWIRLTGDDEPVDVVRLMMLADTLAPSYAATLDELLFVPTVELTVRPAPAIEQTTSPWILLRAVSPQVSTDGWLTERIDMWTPDGAYLGSATQLRLVAPPG